MKKKTIIILAIIIPIFILIVTYAIDMNRMKNNKSVGHSYDINEDEIRMAITDYLINKGDSKYKQHENEKTFASMKIYLTEKRGIGTYYNIYAWVLEEKYYLENDEIKQSSGSSIPYKFVVKNIDGNFTVTDFEIPRDGSYYTYDMKKIFPSNVRNNMSNMYTDGTIQMLENEVEEQAKLYFHK